MNGQLITYKPLPPVQTNRASSVDRASRKFLKAFEQRHGTITCNHLRGHIGVGTYHKGQNDSCPSFVQTAAEILEKLL
jgi:hypothetical protein